MDREPLDDIEQLLATTRPAGAPAPLRHAVLHEIERELRAARWDRRLGRMAVVLLVLGIGMNASLALLGSRSDDRNVRQVAADRNPESWIETAVVVAEMTDVETGRRFARQMAALRGRELTRKDMTAVESALQRARSPVTVNGDKG